MADQNSGDNIKIENIRDSTIIVKSIVGTEPKEIPVPWMAPEPPDDFVPRPHEFEQLRSYLLGATEQEPVAITTALRGAGGYGKTTLAAALCHDQRVRDAFPQGILWITLGEKPTNLPGLVEDVVYALTGERPGFVDLNAAATALEKALEERRCLLVVDDVWNEAHLRPFLRGGKSCTRLITTRNRNTLPSEVQMVDVDAMRQSEAVALLSANLPVSETASLTWLLQKLAQRLGEWPTLLKLINRVLLRRSQQQLLAQALNYVNEALDRRGLTAFDQRDPVERNQAVAKTIGVSLEFLTADEQQLLSELAIFPEDIEIPLSTVQRLWQATGGLDVFDSKELCQQLYDLSLLLQYQLQMPQFIRLHDVLRSYFLWQLGNTATKLHLDLLNQNMDPSFLNDLLNEPYLRRYMIYHLHEAGQMKVLQQQLLNVGWMQGKLEASNMDELLSDYNYLPENPDIQTVKLTLQKAAPFLKSYKGQLLGQLYGRLLDHSSPNIQTMLIEGRRFCNPSGYLIPLTATLLPPNTPRLVTLSGHLEEVTAMALTLSGERVVSASKDYTLKVWNMRTGQEENILSGHSAVVWSVAITSDGWHAISASADNSLKVWNLQSGWEEHTLYGHKAAVNAVATTPNGQYAVSASDDCTLKIWNMRSGLEKYTLSGHESSVRAAAITPDGQRIISASYDCTLKVWSLHSGLEECTFSGHGSEVQTVVITPDGQRAISASFDGILKVWNLRSGQAECTIPSHEYGIVAMAITSNGQRAVFASSNSTLKVWNLHSGLEERTLFSNTSWIQAVAITSDGQYAISTSGSTVTIWDVVNGKIEMELNLDARLSCMATTPDCQTIVVGDRDGTVHFLRWQRPITLAKTAG